MSKKTQKINDRKYRRHEKIDQRTKAEELAKEIETKLEGKKLVPHPKLKDTWIYQ